MLLRIKQDVFVLASDSFNGREAGTKAEIKARDYIINNFKNCGITPLPGDTTMSFAFEFYDFEIQKKVKAYNVIGYIDNKAQYSVVIGAHYDHLGYDSIGNRIFCGADDNASGTAAVMELARYLKVNGPKDLNFILCAFSAEEKGLYGSQAFVNSKKFEVSSTICMLDLDMIGKLGDFGNVLYVNSTKTSKSWKQILKSSKPIDFKIKKIPAGLDGSDHQPFYYKGIPVLFFITGLHNDYHTPRDIASKINYSGEVSIVKYIQNIISKIDSGSKMKFKKPNVFHKIRSNLIYLNMIMNKPK